jgi:DNA-binding NarL/FixJ family response regulator
MKTLTVMIAEDSTLIRTRLCALLAELPHVRTIGEASDADEAILVFERVRPDAAILDLRLRRGSGLEVLRHIKRVAPSCTAIVLTNVGLAEVRQACLDQGADHFFHKATEFEKVIELLEAMGRARS